MKIVNIFLGSHSDHSGLKIDAPRFTTVAAKSPLQTAAAAAAVTALIALTPCHDLRGFSVRAWICVCSTSLDGNEETGRHRTQKKTPNIQTA